MGIRKCIERGGGESRYDYEFRFTLDGDAWLTILFERLDDARDYANEVLCENEDNARFQCAARMMVPIDICDFFDRDKRIASVEEKAGR